MSDMPKEVWVTRGTSGSLKLGIGSGLPRAKYIRADLAPTQTPDTEPPLSVRERMEWEAFIAIEAANPNLDYSLNLKHAREATDAFLAARKEKPS